MRLITFSLEKTKRRLKLFHKKIAAVIFSLICLATFTVQAAESPTIASTSLCGDAYLLALAPEHISALSWQSRSPLSRAGATYHALPQIWDDPEILINNPADIILFGSGEGKSAHLLKADTVTLTWGENFETIEANAALITGALGIDSDVAAGWMDRLEHLKARSEKRASKSKILYLSRSGGSAGTGTLVDAAITAAGGINIAQSSGWFTPDPEEVIAYAPDLIITSYFENGYESVQSTAIRNRAVQRFIAKHPSAEIDGKLWPCAGPGLIEAAELIAQAIDDLP